MEDGMSLKELIDSINTMPMLSDEQIIALNWKMFVESFDDPDSEWVDMED